MTTTMLTEATPLSESSKGMTGKVWRVKVISGDVQGSSAYYPKESLEAGKHLFSKGTRVYGDHPSSDEKWNRPERSYRDIVGVFESDAEYDGKDLYANVKFYEESREFIRQRAEDGVIAMSIRASGEMREGAQGMELARFTVVHSVDVVTVGGAGGAFTQVLESARVPDPEKAASESVAESNKEGNDMEFPKELAEALDALVTQGKANAEAIAALVEANKPAEPAEPKAPKMSEVIEALEEAELSKAGRKAVLAVAEAGGDYAAAIESEKVREAEIRESLKSENFAAHEVEESGKDEYTFGSGFGD